MVNDSLSKMLWRPEELADASGGRFSTNPGVPITGISIDTRTLVPGDVFIAVSGPNHDGHDYLKQAFEAGASCAIVDKSAKNEELLPRLIVAKTDEALTAIARAALKRASKTKRIAITGSVGKTSTKELLSAALNAIGRCHCSEGSLNNHWGVPLSLARMPADVDFAVFEIGMNAPGEIAPLSKLVQPHLAYITTIAPAHLSGFSSFEDLAKEKASIFDGMVPSGIGIIHRDHPHYALAVGVADSLGSARVISFGQHRQANVRLVDYEPGRDSMVPPMFNWGTDQDVSESDSSDHCQGAEQVPIFSKVCYDVYGARIPMYLRAAGRHNAINAAGVLAVGFVLGVDMELYVDAVCRAKLLARRNEFIQLKVSDGYITLIDDSHNANPASMSAAIALLQERSVGRRSVAVLGDMHEMGSDSEAWHAALADYVQRHRIDKVFAAGEHIHAMWERIPDSVRGVHRNSFAEILPEVIGDLQSGDVVLVKGSHASRAYAAAAEIVRFFSP